LTEYVQVDNGSVSAQKPPLLLFGYGGYSMVGRICGFVPGW